MTIWTEFGKYYFYLSLSVTQAALVVDENDTKELEENESAIASTIYLDVVEKVPNVCTKGTQTSSQGPSRRSKGNFIDSI